MCIAKLGNQHVRGDHHISLIFLQALHQMYRNKSFFPIPQTIYKKCPTSSTLFHLHISMDKTYDQVLLRGAMLFGFVFLAAKMVVLSLSGPVIICSVGCSFKDTTLHFFGS